MQFLSRKIFPLFLFQRRAVIEAFRFRDEVTDEDQYRDKTFVLSISRDTITLWDSEDEISLNYHLPSGIFVHKTLSL